MSLAAEATMTVASLVEEALDAMHGYVRDQTQRTSLAVPIDSDDLDFSVNDPSQLSRGLVEIDDELVHVSMVDTNTGVATVEPWGRAQSGTVAAAHAAGARVTMSPLYPRNRVASAVYGVLREVFPDVFAVADTTLTVDPAKTNYPLPADCHHVIGVEWKLPGPTGMWQPAGRWRQNKTATTVELELLTPVWPGANNVRVRYIKIPPAQFTEAGDLAAYGYAAETRDLIVAGVCARMLAFTEAARVQAQSVESHGRSEAVPVGGAQNLARYLYQLFKQRVDDERRQLLARYPIQLHRTR